MLLLVRRKGVRMAIRAGVEVSGRVEGKELRKGFYQR
jgi:hypothetical protein